MSEFVLETGKTEKQVIVRPTFSQVHIINNFKNHKNLGNQRCFEERCQKHVMLETAAETSAQLLVKESTGSLRFTSQF